MVKIGSVIEMEVKTREDELEELLAPDGKLNKDIFAALQHVIAVEKNHSVDDDISIAAYAAFDAAVNAYMQFAIEWDRLQRAK